MKTIKIQVDDKFYELIKATADFKKMTPEELVLDNLHFLWKRFRAKSE